MFDKTKIRNTIIAEAEKQRQDLPTNILNTFSYNLIIYTTIPWYIGELVKNWTRLFEGEYCGHILFIGRSYHLTNYFQYLLCSNNKQGRVIYIDNRKTAEISKIIAGNKEEIRKLEDLDENTKYSINYYEHFAVSLLIAEDATEVQPEWRNVPLITSFTVNPVLFRDYYISEKRDFVCYTSEVKERYVGDYRMTVDSSQMEYYEENEKEQIETGDKDVDRQLKQLMHMGLYDSCYTNEEIVKLPRVFVSAKLKQLYAVLKKHFMRKIIIYIESDEERRILCRILEIKHCYRVEENETDSYRRKLCLSEDTECELPKHICVTSIFPMKFNLKSEVLVFLDFCCSKRQGNKYFILPRSYEGEIREILQAEETIEKDIKYRINSRSQKIYTFRIFLIGKGAKGKVKDFFRDYAVDSMEWTYKFVTIKMSYSLGFVQMLANISKWLQLPVLLQPIAYFSPLTLKTNKIEFGTATSFSEFSDSVSIGSRFLSLENKQKTVDVLDFFMTRFTYGAITCFFKTYRIDISMEDIECILMDIGEETIKILFVLQNRPKVYKTNHIDMYEEGYLNRLNWTRCTCREFEYFDERFDICISVPIYEEKSKDACDSHRQTLATSIINTLFNYSLEIYVTSIYNIPLSTPRLSEVETHFFNLLSFEDFYNLKCLLSRRGRFLVNKIREEDLDFIEEYVENKKLFFIQFEISLKNRFEPVDIYKMSAMCKGLSREEPTGLEMIRSVTISPFSVVFNHEVPSEGNRVLRAFEPNFFLRVSFREENLDKRIKNTLNRNNDRVYDFFREIMLEGLTIGKMKFFFLIMTNSQMNNHSAWFMSPYFTENSPDSYKLVRKSPENIYKDSTLLDVTERSSKVRGIGLLDFNEDKNRMDSEKFTLIGTDYIKDWLGGFSPIKNIGKYAMRVAQSFSSTILSFPCDSFVVVQDVERNGYNFTDGVGLINTSLAKKIQQSMGVSATPSAIQIRYAGFKGVLVWHPWVDDAAIMGEWAERNKVHKNVVWNKQIIFRKSMQKFISSYQELEILRPGRSHNFYLNRQIIMNLEGLGIPIKTFVDLQDRFMMEILEEISERPAEFIASNLSVAPKEQGGFLPNISMDFKFFRKLLIPIVNNYMKDLSTKSKIYVREGRSAIGVTDELSVLQKSEIFLMFQTQHQIAGGNYYGEFFVPEGPAILCKNPIVYPGDIRLVYCVDKSELHYLKEVIVLSQLGDRPVFNEASGSDLDGDVYSVTWNKQLIPPLIYKPYDYGGASLEKLRSHVDEKSAGLEKEQVLLTDIVNFFIRFMKHYQLGIIANSHLAQADASSIFSEKALRLADIFNKSIDFIKTGSSSSTPEDLVPLKYPDFMKKAPGYYSVKAIGFLFRRSRFEIKSSRCECIKCFERKISDMDLCSQIILKGAGVVLRKDVRVSAPKYFGNQRHERGREETQGDSVCWWRENYLHEINLLMNKHNIFKEEDLFLSGEDSLQKELRELIYKYRTILSGKDSRLFVNTECREPTIDSLAHISENANQLTVETFVYGGEKFTEKINKIPVDSSEYFLHDLPCPFNTNIIIRHQSHFTKPHMATQTEILYSQAKHSYFTDKDFVDTEKEYSYRIQGRRLRDSLTAQKDYHHIPNHSHVRDSSSIVVDCDYNNMIKLLDGLMEGPFLVFKELFNLLILTEIFYLSEMNDLLALLLYIKTKIDPAKNLYLEFARVCFALPDNSLFRIVFLLGIDISLFRKLDFADDQPLLELSTDFDSVIRYRRKYLCIVHGMLDEYEEIFMVKKSHVANNGLVPVLCNKGTCAKNYYKDLARDFFVNILYSYFSSTSKQNILGGHQSSYVYEIIFRPGIIFIDSENVDTKIMIVDLLNDYLNDHSRYNLDPLLYTDLNEHVEIFYHVSFFHGGFSYLLIFDEDALLVKGFRNYEMIGKMFVFNKYNNCRDANDLIVELHGGCAIYENNTPCCRNEEVFMLRKGFFNVQNLTVLNSDKLSGLSIKKHQIVELSDGVRATNRNGCSDFVHEGFASWFNSSTNDLSPQFDEHFNLLWNSYIEQKL